MQTGIEVVWYPDNMITVQKVNAATGMIMVQKVNTATGMITFQKVNTATGMITVEKVNIATERINMFCMTMISYAVLFKNVKVY